MKTWIYEAISQPLLHMVLKRNATTSQVWNNLEKMFRDNKDENVIQLDSKLQTISINDSSITD